MGKIFKFPAKNAAIEKRITIVEETLRQSSPNIENLADLQNRIAQIENSLGKFLTEVPDFQQSSETKTGKRGLVPAPPQTETTLVLTNQGWREFTPADVYVSELPSLAAALTYTGEAQTPQWNNYNPLKLTIGGDFQNLTDAGTYTATFTPSGNLSWSDGTKITRYVQFIIKPKPVSVPTVTDTTKTYNKANQSPTISAYDTKAIKVSDNIKKAAGNYSVKFDLASGNFIWSDNSTTTKTKDWKIEVLKLAKPAASVTTLTYSGGSQPVNVSNFNSNYMSRSGTYSATDAGSYTATYSLSDTTNTKWSDNSTAAVNINWKIDPLKIAKPTASKTEYNHTGSTVALEVTNYNSTYINRTGTYEATATGEYTAVYALKSTSNTKWTDGTSASVSIVWKISQTSITIPTWNNAVITYSGNNQTAGFNNYDSSKMTVKNNQGKDAGTYTATFSLKDTTTMKWSDNTTSDKTVQWVIQKKGLSIPYLTETQKSSIVWTGDAQRMPNPTGFDSKVMEILEDTAEGTDAGKYWTNIFIKETLADNYCWTNNPNGENNDVVIEWEIQPKKIKPPTAKLAGFGVTLTTDEYDDKQMTSEYKNFDNANYTTTLMDFINGYDSKTMVLHSWTGHNSYTDKIYTKKDGLYGVAISPNDNCRWEDNKDWGSIYFELVVTKSDINIGSGEVGRGTTRVYGTPWDIELDQSDKGIPIKPGMTYQFPRAVSFALALNRTYTYSLSYNNGVGGFGTYTPKYPHADLPTTDYRYYKSSIPATSEYVRVVMSRAGYNNLEFNIPLAPVN